MLRVLFLVGLLVGSCQSFSPTAPHRCVSAATSVAAAKSNGPPQWSRRTSVTSTLALLPLFLLGRPQGALGYARAPKPKKTGGDPAIEAQRSTAQEYAAAIVAKDEKGLRLLLTDDAAYVSDSGRGTASARDAVVSKVSELWSSGTFSYSDVSETGFRAKSSADQAFRVHLEFDSTPGRKLRIRRINESKEE